MAITNGYITLATLKTELQIDDGLDDARLELSISAASRQIDAHSGRVFWLESGAATRFYNVAEPMVADVLDIASRTGLVVSIDEDDDGGFSTTLTETTDFILEPLNAEYLTPIQPWDRITMVDNYRFPMKRRPGLRVTAVHGYPAVPDAVSSACLIQAKNIYKVTGSGVFGSMQISVDGIPMRIPALDYVAIGLLEPFRKMEV